ncbi:Low complexity coiled coil protein [Cryptosporidium ryanae]|uniref:Low complexity coiled coil protein n=1 Tax=Cryptosporidium ryanae TaxID=515981 RepID=UPI00351A65A2|nr:Low complexity coiled coil protein [Cryptosporidium ryanae]
MSLNGETNSESLTSNESSAVNDEMKKLLLRIKELEKENEVLRTKSVNCAEKEETGDDINSALNEYANDIDGTINYSLQILNNKDEEIKRLNDKMAENSVKWKNYVKLLAEQLGKKNAIIDQIKIELNKLFEKTKNQELINKENNIKLVSYEELIQVDQQLIKQNKQLESELRNKIEKLDTENRKYVNAIKSVNESSKKRCEEYKKKIDKQEQVINNLLSIVDNFRGRYLYNNIGRQKGIINQINKNSKLYNPDCSNTEDLEKMNPLEYEFGIVWKSSQEKITERKCELFEVILNLGEKKNNDKYINDENLYLSDLVTNLDSNDNSDSDNSRNIPMSELILIYSNFVNRIMGLYEIFCKCNLLIQYFQFKALRYLQIDQVNKFMLNGEFTGIIHWICNIVVEVSRLIISAGEIIMRIRMCSADNDVALSTKFPCLNKVNSVLLWINNIFQNAMNDCLNQSNNYEVIKEFNEELVEFLKSSKRDRVLPLCCIDAVLNINISLSITSSIYVKQVDCEKYSNIYKKSLSISDKFYSKCGSLSLNGIHYPIDFRLYSWDGLYWNNIYGQTESTPFNNLFKEMLDSQTHIYDHINKNNNNSSDSSVVSSIEILLSGVQELESNIDKLINPMYTMDKDSEMVNCVDRRTTLSEPNILPELLISKNLQQKLFLQLDDQLTEGEDKQEKKGIDENDNSTRDDRNQAPFLSNTNAESPKRVRMENTVKLLNDRIKALERELTSKDVLYSSFGAMNVEFKKLQDYKQTLMHKVKEQETDIKLKKDLINNNETTIKQLRHEAELLKQNIENLSNLPKIKAYSELDVLEPVYLRRMVRIMNNRLYELEMSRWSEMIIKENPNFLLKNNFNKKFILSQIVYNSRGENDGRLNNIIKRIFKNNSEDDSNYVELLHIVNEYRELKKQVLLHKCSIPIYNNNNLKFKQEWQEYIKRESDLKYKLYIMNKTLQELLSDLRIDFNGNIENSGDCINKRNKIGI